MSLPASHYRQAEVSNFEPTTVRMKSETCQQVARRSHTKVSVYALHAVQFERRDGSLRLNVIGKRSLQCSDGGAAEPYDVLHAISATCGGNNLVIASNLWLA